MSISGIGASNPMSGLPATGGSAAGSQIGARTPADDFLEYARMTPAERIRAAILDEMGITEEELEAMDPEERKAMEKVIAERTKEKVEQATEKRTGMLIDVQA
jgi:TPP-dependent pyruvate/acetoin dehydrogenase alpha subunit